MASPRMGSVPAARLDSYPRLDSGSTRSTIYTRVSPGYHTVSVDSNAGYVDATRLVQVVPGEMAQVSVTLSSSVIPITSPSAATGSIRVYVDRTGSTICIDNLDCFVNVGGGPRCGDRHRGIQ